VESDQFDLVVLDTPPTKHALDFFTAPQRIHALFQDSITRWFMDSGNSGGFIKGLLSRGTRTVIKSLEVLTGGQFIEELVDFFAAMRAAQETLRDRSVAVQKLLAGSQTKFVIVTSFDAAKIEEAKFLQGAIRKLGFTLAAVVVNRAFPVWLKDGAGTTSAKRTDPSEEKLREFFEEFRRYHALRYEVYEKYAASMKGSIQLYRVPDYDQDISGLKDLTRLGERLGEGAV
jgi:anion-transporting  ArsA/GET3 family ATPase